MHCAKAVSMTSDARIWWLSILITISPFVTSVVATAHTSGGAQTPTNSTSTIATIAITVDLAKKDATISVDAGTYRIVLMNAVPGRDYWLHVGPSIALQIPALDAQVAKRAQATVAQGECPPSVTEAAKSVIESADETQVRDRADVLRIALAQVELAKCEGAAAILAATQLSFAATPVVMVGDGVRQLEISSRAGGRWRVRLDSTGRGIWQTTYGFTFSPNRDQEYFSQQTGDDEFSVRRKTRDERSLTFLPPVFFTWLYSSQAFANVQHGPTIGLGVTAGTEGGRLAALGGWALRFNQNIGVVGGFGFYPHRRLDGQYQEGQVIKENLTADQLNHDSIRMNVFVSLTVRFGASPFGGSGAPKE